LDICWYCVSIGKLCYVEGDIYEGEFIAGEKYGFGKGKKWGIR